MIIRILSWINFPNLGELWSIGGTFRLRLDPENQADYESYGMAPYQPNPNRKGMSYWEVSLEILEDKVLLGQWAEKALSAPLRGKKK
jgi:TfoX/Sxy family transcriptional regulator of competence genes